MTDILIKVLIVLAAIGLFVGSYLLNKKVKVPKCVDKEEDKCAHCSNILCRKEQTRSEEKDEK